MRRMDKRISFKQDPIPALTVWAVAGLVCGMFLWLIGDLIGHGVPHLSWDFLTSAPSDAGRQGGISSILASTGLILMVCMAVALPIGLGAAMFLAEFTSEGQPFALFIRRSLDVLAGVPSIVFGLFGNAFFSNILGMGFSILSGGLTLSCMVLPILIRTTEEGFRSLPHEYRLSAAALGLSKTSTLIQLLIPAAIPGLVVGFILGLGRAMAETAALIYTSGYVDRMPESLLDSGRALSIHIYDLSMNVPGGDQAAAATALVLVGCLVIMNSLSTWASHQWARKRILYP
jgi:phosphate transport system permease protein